MKVLFLTNITPPYMVNFCNEHGKLCQLNILFEKRTSSGRDKSWKQYKFRNFEVSTLTFKQVCKYYGRYVLIFPSYIETLGLPPLERKLQKTSILASDCPFSHEALDGNEGV